MTHKNGELLEVAIGILDCERLSGFSEWHGRRISFS